MSNGLSNTTFVQLVDDLASLEGQGPYHTVTVANEDMIKSVRHLREAATLPASSWVTFFLSAEVPEKHILYLGLDTLELDIRAISRLIMEGLRSPKDEILRHDNGPGGTLLKEYR